jgi:hypothetical protein
LDGITKEKYKNEILGIEFTYPKEWGEISFEISPGEVGKKFTGKFSGQSSLVFGGITKDFREGRGAMFTDFRGTAAEIEKYTPAKRIILSDGSSAAIFFNQEISQILGSKSRAARIQLKGPEFFGIAFSYMRIPVPDEVKFDEMIASLQFTR